MADGYFDFKVDFGRQEQPRAGSYVFPADSPSGFMGLTAFEAYKRDSIHTPFFDPISMFTNLAFGRAALTISGIALKRMGQTIEVHRIRITDPRNEFNRGFKDFLLREQIAIDRADTRTRRFGKNALDA